ncbi:MAG: hypothetical protein ABL894_03515 [Hyphomicrobium sp.]
MGTMNFSIPDDLKDKFNEVFKDENKSAVITELMRRAVEERERTQRDENFLEQIRANHARNTRAYTQDEIRKAREDGRP